MKIKDYITFLEDVFCGCGIASIVSIIWFSFLFVLFVGGLFVADWLVFGGLN